MEAITKKQTCNSTSPPSLSIHNDSHTISKAKAKIRIIHIFAPKIIKTDVANFRELVQRLTGKPTENDCKKIKQITSIPTREEEDHDQSKNKAFPSKPLAKKVDMKTGFRGLDQHIVREHQRIIKEEDQDGNLWISGLENNNVNSGAGGFLERFSDLEGFIEEFNGEFPSFPSLLNHPLEASNSFMQYGFGGPQLLLN